MMATCQYKVRPRAYSGDEEYTCGLPAEWLCEIPTAYTMRGWKPKLVEYRCSKHKDGLAFPLAKAQP